MPAIVRALPGAAVLLDLEGRALEASDRFLSLVGHLRGELHAGRPLGWWSDTGALRTLLERAARTGLAGALDGVVTPADGRPVPVRLDATPLAGADGVAAVLGVLTDRSAEHRLSERLRVAVDGGADGLLVFTLSVGAGGRGVVDARLADITPRAASIVGVRVGEVLDRPLTSLVDPEAAQTLLRLFADARTAGGAVEDEVPVRLPSGARPWLRLRATPLGSDEVVVSVRDVTGERGAGAVAARLVRDAGLPVLVARAVRDADGRPVDALLLDADPVTARRLGLAPGAPGGIALSRVLPADARAPVAAAHRQVLDPAGPDEVSVPAPAGGPGTWRLQALPGDVLLHLGDVPHAAAAPVDAVLAAMNDNCLLVRAVRGDDGRVVDARIEAAWLNAGPARMPMARFVGAGAHDLIDPAHVPDLLRDIEEALTGDTVVERRRPLRLRGQEGGGAHELLLRHGPLGDDRLVTTWRDLTRESVAVERLRRTLEGSLDGFQVIEMVRDSHGTIVDGLVVEANERIAEMMGSTRAAYLGTRLTDVAGPRVERVLEQYVRVLEEGLPLEEEVDYSPPGAEGTRWVRYQMLPLGADAVAVLSRDVSERRRAEDDLRRMAEQLSFVARHSSEAISLHAPDGRFQFASEGSVRVWGRAPGDLLGQSALDFVLPGDREAVAGCLARARAEGADEQPLTLRVRWPDGRECPLDTTVRAIRDGLGRLEALLWVARDATPRVEAERRAAERLQESARRAAEQAALRRVATAAAGGGSVESVLGVAAREAALLLEADVGLVVRTDGDVPTVAGTSRADLEPRVGRPLPPGAIPVLVEAGHLPARGNPGTAAPAGGIRYGAAVTAPVRVDDAPWGALVAANLDHRPLPVRAELRLQRFAEIIELAVAAADARARLATQALTDSLTGLPNRRAFEERLREELGRAQRHGRPLSLAILDLDHFKRLNDVHGHQVGDAVLAEVARRLRDTSRAGEMVARVGGEEFGWIIPEAGVEDAREAVERGRRAVAAAPCADDIAVTISAGVADTDDAATPEELFRVADGALYLAKGAGRDMTRVYTPEVAPSLSARVRAARAERGQAVVALRALARRVEAVHPPAQGHHERVADLAQRLARAHGWAPERAQLLHDAALLHDVGMLAVPRDALAAPAPLPPAVRARVEEHPGLGADAVADIVSPDQAEWIRHHHEHWDGRGYPDRRAATAIPEGARLLAVAEAWDAMTAARVHPPAVSPEAALREMWRCAGTQFWPRAVELIAGLVRADGA
ncbi:MAG TPA: diguanylate cyclase [Miltoncostaeaceae bacterium]|nr:diguanylate cyclase [Miltoncostaeaceae bacterium]